MYNDNIDGIENLSTGSIVFSLVIFALTIIAMWKIFTKAGKPGWASIVPIYNLYVLFEITGMNGWMFLLLLVPIANIVVSIMLYIKLAKSFGKGVGFGIGLLLLNTIFTLILGFGSAEYVGTQE